MNKNKIVVLKYPTYDKNAARKKYVDVDNDELYNKLFTLRPEYDRHINSFENLRRTFRRINDVRDNFFGNPLNVDMKLSDIRTIINMIEQKQDNIASNFSAIVKRLDVKMLHKENINNVYSILQRYFTWAKSK